MKNACITTTNCDYTYDVLREDFKNLCSEYSFLEAGTIGKSVLGKDILSLKFGIGRKKILLVGAHHGKEWITSMLLMAIIENLCFLYQEQGRFSEIDIRSFFQKNTIYVIPMLNPDGVGLCINGLTKDIPIFLRSRLIGMNSGSKDFIGKWQANIHGVDLNHNYDALFEKGKTLAFANGIYGPGPTRFSGEHPESEPESRALAEFTREILPDIAIAYHSQGEEIFYRFNGHCPKKSAPISNLLAAKTGYRLIDAAGLTDCSGYKDWAIQKFDIPAFTMEVGKGENPLPLSQFPKIFEANFKAIVAL